MATSLTAANSQIKKLRKEIKKLKKLTLDGLTGLMQRRVFEGFVVEEILRCKRSEKQFSLLVIDLNNLKKINDTRGHRAGDAMIIAFSKMLERSLREGDVLARTGGDEFMVFLPETNATSARVVKKNLLARFESEKGALPFFFGAAIGASTFGNKGQTFEKLYDIADKAMYKHKKEMKSGKK